MKKPMKKTKKIALFLFVVVSFVASLSFLSVNAASTAPSTIKMKDKSGLYYYSGSTAYIDGHKFYRKVLKDGTIAYCVSNNNKKVPAGQTLNLKSKITDKGLEYILKNGYPNKSFTGDDKKDFYITQSAIWLYYDKTKGSSNWKGTTFNANSTGMKGYVYKLTQEAIAAKDEEVPTPKISISNVNEVLHISSDGNYFVSDPVQVNLTNTKGVYTVELTNAPKGTILKNEQGEEKTTFNDGERFIINVPATSVKNGEKGTASLKIKADGVTYGFYKYGSTSIYQVITPTTTYEEITKMTSEELTFNFEKAKTTVKISKQDVTTKEELPGATLEVKDKNGKVVDKWVSTSEPHYIIGLEPGDYTLTETIAPKGYVLSKSTIKFTVKADGTTTNVIMYNEKEDPTKVKISKQDITTKEELPGATLEVRDKYGNVVDTWVSTTEPHYIEGLEPGSYVLTETIAPDGYILSEEAIIFIVKDDGTTTNVIMYNAPETKTTKVKVSKQDITTKEELPGATLEIKDKNGKVVDEWVSTTEAHYIEGLEPGEYTLTEKIAPEGYILSKETIKFTVKDDGSLTSVVMFNEKFTEVPITDLNVSSITMIFASVLIVLGTGMVVYYAKRSK